MLTRIVNIGIVAGALLFLSNAMLGQERYGGSMNAKEHGFQHGYRDGLRQARADLNRNVAYNVESEDYRRADLGYEEYMGERDDFQHGYRDGYKSGYDDAFNNRPLRRDIYGLNDAYDPDQRPRSYADGEYYEKWHYSDVATDTGYRDGLQAGYQDLRERKDFHPEKHDAYEDGNHGFRKNYGDKGLYKDQYRKAFVRGYEDAFNQNRR